MLLVWWGLLIAQFGVLIGSIVVNRRARGSGAAVPDYIAGNVSLALAGVLLCLANIVGLDTTAGLVTLGASVALMGWSGAAMIRARRRAARAHSHAHGGID